MPAVSALSSTQLNTIRSGGYGGELRIAPALNPVVFKAAVNQTITSSVFISFAWDGLISGAFASVKPGMTFFITATSASAELRSPIFRGRVTQAPTSTLFYCNEASFNLLDGYIVTVIDTREVLQKDRSGALVDGFQTYANLPPAVKNLQSFYYGESIGAFSFSFAPTGQAMASGATISSYLWSIPGATFTSGSSSTQNVTVSVPYGRLWASLTITDSNAVSNRFDFEILVCTRDDPTYMFQAHGDVVFNDDLDAGLNVSVTYFDGVENLLNRTRVAIITFDRYKSGSGAFSNVMFVGYLVNEETTITADLVSSTLSETRFEIQSFSAIAAQLPVPSLAIRHTDSPSAWEQVKRPTTQRVIWHLMTRYSTLGNLCAVNFVTTDDTWFGGNMDLEASTLLESINKIGEEIQAKLVFFPEGDAAFEINANFLSTSDRNALPSLITSGQMTPADLINYSLPLPYYKTVGQVEAGFASFQTSGANPVKLGGVAPATVAQEGGEKPVIPAQLLASNLTAAQAITAAKQRIGDLLEYLNPPELINLTFHDGWRFLTLSTRVWVKFDLPATDSTRGLAVPSTDRYILFSLSKTWHLDGTWDISGSARLETQGGVAQINVYISPTVVETDLPVLPANPDYDAFLPDGTLNYLSSVPGNDAQPYDNLLQFQPMLTGMAGNIAFNLNRPGCTQINPPLTFKSSITRSTDVPAIFGEEYTITVNGWAQIDAGGSTTVDDDLDAGLGANTHEFSATFPFGVWNAGSPTRDGPVGGAWVNHDGRTGGGSIEGAATGGGLDRNQAGVLIDLGSEQTVTAASFWYKFSVSPGLAAGYITLWDGSKNLLTEVTLFTSATNTTYLQTFWSGSVSGVRYVSFQCHCDAGAATAYVDDISATYNSGDVPIFGDAFYQWEEGGAAEPYDVSHGLRVDGSAPTPPPFNSNHEYTFPYTGTGATVDFSYEDTSYVDNNNVPLYIRVCGPGMS